MANFLIHSQRDRIPAIEQQTTPRPLVLRLSEWVDCDVSGSEQTYTLVKDKDDLILAIGYVSMIGSSPSPAQLMQLLGTFNESRIGELKERLIGEFILIVKKGDSVFAFSDFMGTRNIFYSTDGTLVSSSFKSIEDLKGCGEAKLDPYKLSEFLAMGHSVYPCWIGQSTYHRDIQWLRPNEFLVFDTKTGKSRLGKIHFHIDNTKQDDVSVLSEELIMILQKTMSRKGLSERPVAASLTGGHDSRMIASIAAGQFPSVRFRTAVSSKNPYSIGDLRVARKIAAVMQVPLDIYSFQEGRDERRFADQTEGLSSDFNNTMAPLLSGAGDYSLGLGGAFGTELFMPIRWKSIDDFIGIKVSSAQRALLVKESFWAAFQGSLHEEFDFIKTYYDLKNYDERDYVRLFYVFVTARYGSFIFSAFNQEGYQLDPYGSYPVLELALRVSPKLWGDHRRLRGNSIVQKAAMAKLDPVVGRLTTYGYSRPMLPLSLRTLAHYLAGYAFQVVDYIIQKKILKKNFSTQRYSLPDGGIYVSDAWPLSFLKRTSEKYGISQPLH